MKKNESLIKQIKAMGSSELYMAMRNPAGEFVMYVRIEKHYACDMLSCQQEGDKTEFFLGTCPDGEIHLGCK
jgi:hypothetical protein